MHAAVFTFSIQCKEHMYNPRTNKSSSPAQEFCPWCGEPEAYRLRDGTAARVCKNHHKWLKCVECATYFDPDKTQRVLGTIGVSHDQWWTNFKFLCPACAIVDRDTPCDICGKPRYLHTPSPTPFPHGFTSHNIPLR